MPVSIDKKRIVGSKNWEGTGSVERVERVLGSEFFSGFGTNNNSVCRHTYKGEGSCDRTYGSSDKSD